MSDMAMGLAYVEVYFERFYHIQTILDAILRALNDVPRRLVYASAIAFLQYNRPERFGTDAEEFLFHCFDTNGKFTVGCAAWLLLRMGVLCVPAGGVLDEDAMFPALDESLKDSIRASRERILHESGDGVANDNNAAVLLDEIRHSTEAALAHSCDGHDDKH